MVDRLGKLKPVIIDRYYAKVEADKKAAAEGAAAQKAAAAAAKAQQDAASAAAQKAGAAAKAAATSSAGARAGGGLLSDSFANLRVAKPRSGGPAYKPQGKAYPTVPTSFATYVVLGVSMPATSCSPMPPFPTHCSPAPAPASASTSAGVSEARLGLSRSLGTSKLRSLQLPADLTALFLAIAEPNTHRKPRGLETCGILGGKMVHQGQLQGEG